MNERHAARLLPLSALVAAPVTVPEAIRPDPDAQRRELAAAFAPELDALRAAAAEQGRREGEQALEAAVQARLAEHDAAHAEHLEAATQRLEEARATLLRAAEALREQRAMQLRELEADCIEVAHAALLRLLGARAADGSLLPDLVRNALEQLGTQRVQRIRLARADLARLDTTALAAGLELVPDEALAPGDCVIETNRGALDASLERQLAGLRAALLAAQRAPEAGA